LCCPKKPFRNRKKYNVSDEDIKKTNTVALVNGLSWTNGKSPKSSSTNVLQNNTNCKIKRIIVSVLAKQYDDSVRGFRCLKQMRTYESRFAEGQINIPNKRKH
jgi:hypothetical protein